MLKNSLVLALCVLAFPAFAEPGRCAVIVGEKVISVQLRADFSVVEEFRMNRNTGRRIPTPSPSLQRLKTECQAFIRGATGLNQKDLANLERILNN